MKKYFIFLILVLTAGFTQAQCAMCRTTLQNNVSQGDPGIAAGINFGILYLLAAPYLAVGLLGFFWYRSSQQNAKHRLQRMA